MTNIKGMMLVSVVLASALLALGLLVSCTPRATPAPATPAPVPAAPAVSPEWQQVLEAGKREGTVVVFEGARAPRFTEALISEFPRQTGIRAEVVSVSGAEIRERIRMEDRAGAYQVDVLISALSTPADIVDWGFGQPVPIKLPVEEEMDVFRVKPWQYDPQRRLMVWSQNVEPIILINTNLVKPQDEPKSWHDLLDPKWKGKIIITDPRFPGGSTLMAYSASELGKDYWSKIPTQNPRLERNANRVIDAVVLGEKPIAIFAQSPIGAAAIAAGAPVKFLHLEEGSALMLWGGTVVKNTPHPNAAIVFMNWLLSKQGHETVMRAFESPGLRKDLKADWIKIPELLPGAERKLFSRVLTSPKHSQESIAFMQAAMGKP